jgi:opacity protein-like surface antigen
MKTLMSKALMLLCLMSAVSVASADDRFTPRYGYGAESRYDNANVAGLQWRLGDSRGAGREILFRARGDRRWQVAPGEAVAVNDGWVLGTDRHRGGFGIYRWNGRGWSRMPGEATEIGGSYQQPWVVNALGVRYIWNGGNWSEVQRGGRGGNYRDDDRNFRRDGYRR